MIKLSKRVAVVFFGLLIATSFLSSGPADARARKECKANHFHYGTGRLYKKKKRAISSAIRSWASFTEFEYGSAWADFRRSGNRSINCRREGRKGWTCRVKGRPCRRI